MFVLVATSKGWRKAAEDIGPSLFAAASTVIVAIIMYCINAVKGASSLDAEQALEIQKMEQRHTSSIDALKARFAADASELQAQLIAAKRPIVESLFPKIDIEFEGAFRGFVPADYRLAAEKDGLVFFLPEVSLINREDADFVLELWLVGSRGEHVTTEFEADKLPHPHIERVKREGKAAIGDNLPGLINVTARQSKVGYVTFTVQKPQMDLFGITIDDAKSWGFSVPSERTGIWR